MNIVCDAMGFIYFNDLFFFFMKSYQQIKIDKFKDNSPEAIKDAEKILKKEEDVTKAKLKKIK